MKTNPRNAGIPCLAEGISADGQENCISSQYTLSVKTRSTSTRRLAIMKYFAICLLLFSTRLYGLDADEIKAIAEKPHSRDNLVEALKIYPEAREYKVTLQYGRSADTLVTGPEFVSDEKTVDGRYIVSLVKFPGEANPLIMVVTYEDKTDIFRKWVLLPDGKISVSTGVADFEKRTISWLTTENQGKSPLTVISIETHTDEMSTWKETTLNKEKVMMMSRGKAVKIK